MGRTKYPGIKWTKLSDKVERTEVSFQRMCEHGLMNQLIKPPHQGVLQDQKVLEMVKEYCEHPDYWTHKQIITISVFNDSYYITDGQHRIEAGKSLYTDHGKSSATDYLIFNWHIVDNEDEMRNLYNSINKDSTKNEIFVTQDIIIQARAENFFKFFKGNYKDLFPNKVNQTNKRYPLELFRDELLRIDFFDREKHQELNIFQDFKKDEAFEQFVLRSASEYFKLYDYERYINENQLEPLFYADEIRFIREGQVFMFMRNNFLDWLKHKNIKPKHNIKNLRTKIPVSIRNSVWKKEFGGSDSGVCPISTCDVVIKKKDTSNPWHCGHVISHYNGGKMKLENLRPICAQCNLDMDSKNWNDYEETIKQFQ